MEKETSIYTGKTITMKNPREKLFEKAKILELDSLATCKTWTIMSKKQMFHTKQIFWKAGSFLRLRMKERKWKDGTPDLRYKDIEIKLKTYPIHNLATARHNSVKLLLALGTTFQLQTFSTDITLAHISRTEPLLRDVYLKTAAELKLDDKNFWSYRNPFMN